MSKARLVITAVVVEGRSPGEVAAAYGVARSWVYELVARYRAEGDLRSSHAPGVPRPHRRRSPASTVELIVELRQPAVAEGLDAGADTIAWHLEHHHGLRVSRATIDRTLRRQGLVVPAPRKRPRSSYIRFAADQPNEMWQADFTHYPLTDGADAEILSWLDDHARYALSITAHPRVTGPIVVDTFRSAIAQHGPPASTLDRQRDGVHHPPGRRPRRPQRLRDRTPPPRHHPEELPTQPPRPPAARSNASNKP